MLSEPHTWQFYRPDAEEEDDVHDFPSHHWCCDSDHAAALVGGDICRANFGDWDYPRSPVLLKVRFDANSPWHDLEVTMEMEPTFYAMPAK